MKWRDSLFKTQIQKPLKKKIDKLEYIKIKMTKHTYHKAGSKDRGLSLGVGVWGEAMANSRNPKKGNVITVC